MNKYWSVIICTAWLGVFTLGAAPWEPGLVAQIHFAGAAAVSADPNSAGLKNLWSSPEALALRNQTLDKLAKSMDLWLHQQVGPGLTGPLPLRPLLDDLCQSEWQLDLRQPAGNGVAVELAVRLDPSRDPAWQTSLGQVVNAWKMTSPAHQARLFRNGGWLVLEISGNAPLPAAAPAIASLQSAWLSADIDWSRLDRWFPGVDMFALPAAHVQVAGRVGNFEINGKLFLSQPLPPPGAWQIPVNAIHPPLIGFTAARDISGWLKQQRWIASLGLDQVPDQAFGWVMPQLPFQTYAAFPLASASAALPKIERSVSVALHDGTLNSSLGRLTLNDTNDQFSISGMPFIVPYLKAERDASGELLLAGFFPNNLRNRPLTPDYQARINRPDLVYYDWEATSARLKIFPQLYQLLFLFTGHRQLNATSAAGKWLDHIGSTLGASVTEVTETAPNELTFSRKATAGLTAVELVALGSWLEAPNFPGCNLRLPKFPMHLRPKTLGAPGAPKPAPFMLHQ